MKIIYADMSIEKAKFLLSVRNGSISVLDTHFGVSALREVISKTSFTDFDDTGKIYLMNSPLVVEMVADEVLDENNGDLVPFLKSFRVLDGCGNLHKVSVESVDFCGGLHCLDIGGRNGF